MLHQNSNFHRTPTFALKINRIRRAVNSHRDDRVAVGIASVQHMLTRGGEWAGVGKNGSWKSEVAGNDRNMLLVASADRAMALTPSSRTLSSLCLNCKKIALLMGKFQFCK
ncbi:Diphtheria toxin repressor [Trichinella spiralis]|uniref:Diphtheria toxin repressor n=1 Tax=Trichinella spiralis TaxID=6334 RepID=A0ABR3KK07_TRISP